MFSDQQLLFGGLQINDQVKMPLIKDLQLGGSLQEDEAALIKLDSLK